MRYMAATTLTLAFAAAPLLAQDHAVPRGGGSSGGGSSSGSGHVTTSSGSGSSSSSSSSSGSGYSASSSGGAERRHPRAGTGTGNRYYGGGGYYPGSGYYPWYPWYYPSSYAWGPYWGSYYYGYWPMGAYYSGGYAPPSYRSSNGVETGAVRVLVDPEDAKVYVDGYYAGIVDDFDGLTQRLYLTGGTHEILLKREGYQSIRYRIYVLPGETQKIDHEMVKGAGEETLKDLTGGRGDRPEVRYAPDSRPRDGRGDDEDVEDAPPPRRPARDDSDVDVRPGSARGGALEISVRPGDASVYVDGDFRGSAKQIRSLELGAGSHRIEVVRPGYQTFQREIEITAGRTEDLEVVLAQP